VGRWSPPDATEDPGRRLRRRATRIDVAPHWVELVTTALDEVARRLGPLVRRDVPLGPMTTYRVGGAAALFARCQTEAELDEVAAAVAATDVATLVVGKGSNLLVADRGFAGLAVALAGTFEAIDLDTARPAVTAGAAVALPTLARRSAAAGLCGFEWAVGVPGSVGGAVRMNAGGHGSDMAASVVSADVVDLADGSRATRSASELAFGYRSSAVAVRQVVTRVRLALREGDSLAAKAEIDDIVRWRREHQPGGQNAGSVFTNPPGASAGRLVDDAGLKGMRVGTAQVSDKHANFIQADDGGRADDVVALIRAVRHLVHEHVGVVLHPELRLAGFAAEDLVGVVGDPAR
jgi:UDP-N-acetylmuramate dehydrogenase